MSNSLARWIHSSLKPHGAVAAFRVLEEANPELRDRKLPWRLLVLIPAGADSKEQESRILEALAKKRIANPTMIIASSGEVQAIFYFASWATVPKMGAADLTGKEVLF